MSRWCVCLLAVVFLAHAGIDEINNEPNLERRSRLALEHASAAFKAAQTAYANGEVENAGNDLKEVQRSVEIARDALEATGKNARKSPKYFKSAEKDSRELIRRMEGLENAMGIEDRPLIEGPKAKIQEVHDQWVHEIMSGK